MSLVLRWKFPLLPLHSVEASNLRPFVAASNLLIPVQASICFPFVMEDYYGYLTTEVVNLNHTKRYSETHRLKTNMKIMLMSMILKVLDHVKKLLKTMLVEMLGPDVS